MATTLTTIFTFEFWRIKYINLIINLIIQIN